MKTEPILCLGNELKSVLDGIESRNGVVTDLHTGVGGNAGYRVNYFERVRDAVDNPIRSGKPTAGEHPAALTTCPNPERFVDGVAQLDRRSVVTRRVIPEAASTAAIACSNHAAINNFGSVAEKAGAGSSRTPLRQLTACASENLAATNQLNAGKEPTNSAGKSPKGSDQVTPEELRADKLQSGVERQTESRVEDCHQHSNSIETRIAELKKKFTAAGKIKRIKSSTPREHARLPHKND